jgi:hypothetical protein
MSLDALAEPTTLSKSLGNRSVFVLAIVSLLPLTWTMHSAWLRLAQPNPQSPWESAILMDAWRAHHGFPVYTLPSDDHATHMYGPLITYAVAPFMHDANFSLRPARYIAILSSIALAISMGFLLTRHAQSRSILFRFIVIVLVLTQFYRTRADIAESRPDAVSAAFAALAVWLFYLASCRSPRALYTIAGTVAMLIGFFFKQTAAAVAIVPVVACILSRPVRIPLSALVPPVVMGLTILALRLFLPAVYYYVVTVPTLFQFRFDEWPFDIINLITTNVLFDIALFLWLAGICTSAVTRSATIWILATILVTAISCGAAVAKVGGQTNSYLMAFLAMSTFTIILLPDMLEQFASRPVMITSFLALVLLADATGVAGYLHWTSFTRNYGDARYKIVVNRTKHLPGKVVCPDDPTIPLKAKGYVGRNLVAELDALGWKSRPAYLHAELKKADYVIRVGGDWTPQVSVKELAKLGFRPVNDPAFKNAYLLYRRTKR